MKTRMNTIMKTRDENYDETVMKIDMKTMDENYDEN